jgi:integrase
MASIHKIPSGRFRVKWRGADNRQQSRSFTAKADADAFKRQVERELDDGLSISSADRKLTVSGYVNRPNGWRAAQAWRPLSRERFDTQWRAHLEPRWGNVRLTAITRTAVQSWVNDLSASGLAPGTVKGIYGRLASIMKAAHADGVIARQPVTKIVLPERPAKRTVVAPTLEQIEQIARAVSPKYEALVWACATLGLRPGEAIGLTVERVNFLRKIVTVDQQMVSETGKAAYLAPVKTSSVPTRELPIPDELIERLAAHLDRYPAVPIDAQPSEGGTVRLIFANVDGGPIRRTGLQAQWSKVRREIELPAELRGWHSLRHYAITRLIGAGVNPDYVRQFAGHSTLTETLNTYAGFWPSDADNAREALTAALGGIGATSPQLSSV